MSLLELFLLAIGLSMDAFAVAVCTGLTMKKTTPAKMLIVGIYFGFFQAAMPLFGYMAATLFADSVIAFGNFIAFGLLSFLGGKMIIGSLKKDSCSDRTLEASLKPSKMLPLALATSIDALAVGVSFAFIRLSIVPAISLIGVTTLALSMLGVKIGNLFGTKFKSKAEIAGGIILIVIGLRILLEHFGVINFE